MSDLHPTIAQVFAPYIKPLSTAPVICRRCDDVIDAKSHTLDDCESTQQEKAIAADLALDRGKAHRRNNEDFARALKFQAQLMDAGVLS